MAWRANYGDRFMTIDPHSQLNSSKFENEFGKTLDQISSVLRAKKWTLALAESCTGGLLSSQITKRAGVSDFYLGGIVSYANSIKEMILKVPASTLIQHGAVSEQTARAMAHGARESLAASCAIAITGVAGPSGGTALKPVGTVWIAATGPGFELCEQYIFTGDRNEVQNQSALQALLLLSAALLL